MIRRPPRSTQSRSSAASDVYKRQMSGKEGDIFRKVVGWSVGSDHRTLPYVHAVLRSASSSSTGRRSEARLVPMSAAAPMGGYRADERPEACHCSNAGRQALPTEPFL